MSYEIDIFNKIYMETRDKETKWETANFVESQRLCEIIEREATPQKTFYLMGKNKSIVAIGTFVHYDYPEGEQRSMVDYFFSIGRTKKDYLNKSELLLIDSIEVESIRTYFDKDLAISSYEISDLYKIIIESHLQLESMIDDF